MIERAFWENKKVFVTGHTGFKGSWLCLWLHLLGAKVTGFALESSTNPSLFRLCNIESLITSIIGDIRQKERVEQAILASDPDIVIHMAAQPLVRKSYENPAETFAVNVMGTVHLLEAVRSAVEKGSRIRAVINVTTDKCYENKEWPWGYRENDPLGGYDPYSSSKACSELVTSAYRNSFFNPQLYAQHGIGIASARAGNVIGGGDWAANRLIPDCLRALLKGEVIKIHHPTAIRPWQHVLEPLSGYLLLAQKLYEQGSRYGEAWNFGPNDHDAKPVEWIVKKICAKWAGSASYEIDQGSYPHEAHYLKLDCSKAKAELGWHPCWDLQQAIEKVLEWTRAYMENQDVRLVCFRQIKEYSRAMSQRGWES